MHKRSKSCSRRFHFLPFYQDFSVTEELKKRIGANIVFKFNVKVKIVWWSAKREELKREKGAHLPTHADYDRKVADNVN